MTNINSELSKISCMYCGLEVPIEDDIKDFHDSCHEEFKDFQNSTEYEAAKSMVNRGYNDYRTTDLNLTPEERQNRLLREQEAIRRRNEQIRENRRNGAIEAARTKAFNKENQIVMIKPNLYYQFIDNPECVIFVNYNTIIGVLWNHEYITCENNFSQTTGQHIAETYPYGSRIQEATEINWDYPSTFDSKEEFQDNTFWHPNTERQKENTALRGLSRRRIRY